MTSGEKLHEDHRSAEERFREALGEFPRSTALLERLGKCLALQGRVEEALECNLTSLEIDPAQPRLLLRVADLFAMIERFEEVMRFCEHYQALRPESSRGYARMGDCLLRQGFFWSAADAYSIALAKKPDSRLLKERVAGVNRLCASYLD